MSDLPPGMNDLSANTFATEEEAMDFMDANGDTTWQMSFVNTDLVGEDEGYWVVEEVEIEEDE